MDAAEVLAALEADPALRAAARRIILTDELLALPDLVRENSRQIAELRQTVAGLQEAVAGQQQTMASQSQTVAGLQEAVAGQQQTMASQSQTVAGLQEAVAELRQTVAGLQEAVAELRDIVMENSRQILGLSDRVNTLGCDLSGLRLELRYRDHAYGYFGSLVRRARTLGSGEVADLLGEAVERGGLSSGEAAEVALADLLVAGTDGGEPTYLVVEVSSTLRVPDVDRAARRAALLSRAGLRAKGVAAGIDLRGPLAEHADEAGVTIVLDGRLMA